MTWHTSSILITAVVLLPLVSGCQTDAEEVDCDALCTRLDAMGCALTVVEGSGGATGGSPGCVDVCHQSSREASGNGCTEAWARFTDCLMEASSLTCHGPSFEEIAGCDAERQAWDLCDGTECDVRDGLVASGTTSEGVLYSLVFGRPDCECQPGMESPAETRSVPRFAAAAVRCLHAFAWVTGARPNRRRVDSSPRLRIPCAPLRSEGVVTQPYRSRQHRKPMSGA